MLQPENVCHPHPSQTAVDVLILLPSDRTKRVKDAKSEAQKEIEEYRKKKEEEFKKFESEVQSPSPLHLGRKLTHLIAIERKQES